MGVAELELLRALDAPCRALGVELDDVVVQAGVVRVTVEREAGLDLDFLAEVSRTLSAFLDDHDTLAPAGRYELEVSSPGLERRLRRPEQFQRVLGQRVAVRTCPGIGSERRFEAVLISAEASGVTFERDGGAHVSLAYDQIERARTVFDWQAALAERRAAERGGSTLARGVDHAGRSKRGREEGAADHGDTALGLEQIPGDDDGNREKATTS